MNKKKRNIIVHILFTVYLALLIKVILFKYPMFMIREILKSSNTLALSFRVAHGSNFVPLKSIFELLFNNHNIGISLENIFGNIIAFAPFGFLLPLLNYRMNKLKSVALSSLILSLAFEIIQLLTGLGQFDVDDIFLNVLGAVLGYLLVQIFTRFIKNINHR